MAMDRVTGSAMVFYRGVRIQQPIGGYAHVVLPTSSVESNIFATGHHYWSARLVCHKPIYGGIPRLVMSLHLWSRGDVKVKASWELSVIDPLRGSQPPTTLYTTAPEYFGSPGLYWDLDYVYLSERCFWQFDDRGSLVLQITVTLFPEDDPGTAIGKQIDVVPPSDMLDQLGEVFQTREGADVTFSVDGELIQAHKIVLAMRSRVFKAQLYGEMKESGAQPIVVCGGITADMFRALLRYIYTDSSPASSGNRQDEEEGSQEDSDKVWDLLTAADVNSVERLKLICERILCKRLDVDNVAEMLGHADRHHCGTLKDACIEFMTTSNRMDQVKKSQGFLKLKDCHPCLLVEVLEKSSKF